MSPSHPDPPMETASKRMKLEDVKDEVGELGDDEDKYPIGLAQTPSQKKRQHDAIFTSLFQKRAGSITMETLAKAITVENEETLSLKAIMAKQESARISSTPREYQMELFGKAKEENTIAVLDTGSGKTLIAVLLLKHIIDQELEDRASGMSPRISFFLVDKVTLVFQQSAVLEANIDQKVGFFCGAMGCDLWSKQTWTEHFHANMVVVLTAEILYQCLSHAFITMDQVNLLIFDEAHHSKKSHVYARIIRDFYKPRATVERRPRIFGMTASPVDVDTEYSLKDKAEELEILLHSRIATTSHWSELSNFVFRPEPLFITYAPLRLPYETQLFQQIWARYWDVDLFRPLFERAKQISSLLGSWCSDYYWSFAFLESGARKYEARLQQLARKGKSVDPSTVVDAQLAQYKAAHNEMAPCFSRPPVVALEDLSSKVVKLYGLLQVIFAVPSGARCLVFVERRSTARLLKAVFDQIGGSFMKADFLMGASGSQIDDLHYSIKQQAVTVSKFRNGDLNCLFATSVAEEGLDIQSCGYVIRFDPCKTMIQYVQSRGRARQKDSKFFHLVEEANWVEEDRLDAQRRCEDIMREFCRVLPKDRLLSGNSEEFESTGDRDRTQRVYIEPSTGAKLTYDFSLAVLAHFVGSLPHSEDDDMSINYAMSCRGSKFICEVILPARSPVPRAMGREYKRKSTAKRSAAFEACISLRSQRYLDENLLPVYTKKVVAMRNALLVISSKCNEYPMQAKPTTWSQGRGEVPETMFMTILKIVQPWDRPVCPLALITRAKLPDFPQFPIFRRDGSSSKVQTMALAQSFTCERSLVSQLTGFTLAVYQDLFNKTFEHNSDYMSYWIAPLVNLPAEISEEFKNPVQLIDWIVCEKAASKPAQSWTRGFPESALMERFFIDPFHGGRRWFTTSIAQGLHPSDPMPSSTSFDGKFEHVKDYSLKAMFRVARARAALAFDEMQPVIRAEEVSHRLNVLAQPYGKIESEAMSPVECLICPGPLQVSQLPITIVGMALLFPAIIHRVEAYLIALEFCQQLQLSIKPALALEAITKDSDNTDETQGERINFQHGMGPNYERLEFLGDCFLKMATSISLFAQHIGQNEEEMHIKRMLMLCNKNLFKTATDREYFKYIRSRQFSRRTWYPEGLRLLKGKGAQGAELNFNSKHALGDKTIADVCEAIIGAAFVSHFDTGYGGTSQMDDAVKAVSSFVNNSNHTMQEWADYYRSYKMPTYQVATSNASQLDLAAQVERKHGYHFRYPRLLRCAFQHSSLPQSWDGLPSYQRLEFLGDSLLDMAAVTYLFKKHPTRDAQWLTEHKMAMVSNKFLGALCVRLGFYKHLRHCQPMIGNQVQAFVQDIEQAEEQSNGARDYWTTVRDAPKCLSDMVESYVGAMFVDSEFDYREVQRFFDEHILWYFEDVKIYDSFANNHPMARLHSFLRNSIGCKEWFLRAADIPAADTMPAGSLAFVVIHGTAVGEGYASSSRYAKMKAASNALEKLQGLTREEFRSEYGCKCGNEAGIGTHEATHSELEVEGANGAEHEARLELDETIGTAI